MAKVSTNWKRALSDRQSSITYLKAQADKLRYLHHSEQAWAVVFLIPLVIGLANFASIVKDQRFWTAMHNTVLLVLITVPLKIVIGLGLGILLNHRVRGVSFFRLAYFFPFTCSVVAIALLWSYLYDPDGLLNTMLALFSLNKVYWLSAQNALKSISLVLVWDGMGYIALLFLAALQNIPQEYYDACRVDGASKLQQLRYVTLPLLTPTTFFVLVILLISAFQTFGEVYVLQGPQDSTLTIVQYIYEKAFSEFDMGYAAALSYILIVIIFAVTMIQLQLQKKWVRYDL